ncbi:MAG: RsmB/NOP family class I SAM-dependent RNA methyltransferase, partial [Pseudomonadota bacterium]
MRPEARVAAAIEILDSVLGGASAEQRLTTWARGNRYAGSSDRAAIRDIVFDALRRRRSYAWLGAGETGRALMIGALRAANRDPSETFTGARHAPSDLMDAERHTDASLRDAPAAVRHDFPDWLWPEFVRAWGEESEQIAGCLRDRAPVFLRTNRAKTTPERAAAMLRSEEIDTRPHPLAPTALEVVANARRVRSTRAFAEGHVELQDAASQALVLACLENVGAAGSVLDYCAGGGGKALTFAAEGVPQVVAHDADPRRMSDIPARPEQGASQSTRSNVPCGCSTRSIGVPARSA